MTYADKEIYETLQGLGAHTGRPTVFCGVADCNLKTVRNGNRPPNSK